LMIKGFGWGGPTLGAVLDEQKQNDITETIDGVKFVVDNEEAEVFENCKVFYSKTIFGETFKVVSSIVASSTC
jgi:Fe-S cluster assembly iron-binding protein IscA